MAESEVNPSPVAASNGAKKDRSPSFPFITLTKAVERTRSLFDQAKRHEMRLSDAATAMGYGAKSSGVIQTLAALIAFGLVEDSGSGDARKFKVSDLGFKVLADQRPGARESALADAAFKPKLIAEYAAVWSEGRPSDAICLSELHIDRGFTEDGAKTFLRVFDDAVRYFEVADAGKQSDKTDQNGVEAEQLSQQLEVGDFVRVETGGQIVFEKTRVRQIDGQWVFVDASQSGAKMSDVTFLEKGARADEEPPTLAFARPLEENTSSGEELDRFTVDEGVVKIVFPSGMASDSVEELEQFFALFIKKAKRRAGSESKSG